MKVPWPIVIGLVESFPIVKYKVERFTPSIHVNIRLEGELIVRYLYGTRNGIPSAKWPILGKVNFPFTIASITVMSERHL